MYNDEKMPDGADEPEGSFESSRVPDHELLPSKPCIVIDGANVCVASMKTLDAYFRSASLSRSLPTPAPWDLVVLPTNSDLLVLGALAHSYVAEVASEHESAAGKRMPPEPSMMLGVLLIVSYWLQRGHDVVAFFPTHWHQQRTRGSADVIMSSLANRLTGADRAALHELVNAGIAALVPPGEHDDIYCIEYAWQRGGFVVSNDRYLDHCQAWFLEGEVLHSHHDASHAHTSRASGSHGDTSTGRESADKLQWLRAHVIPFSLRVIQVSHSLLPHTPVLSLEYFPSPAKSRAAETAAVETHTSFPLHVYNGGGSRTTPHAHGTHLHALPEPEPAFDMCHEGVGARSALRYPFDDFQHTREGGMEAETDAFPFDSTASMSVPSLQQLREVVSSHAPDGYSVRVGTHYDACVGGTSDVTPPTTRHFPFHTPLSAPSTSGLPPRHVPTEGVVVATHPTSLQHVPVIGPADEGTGQGGRMDDETNREHSAPPGQQSHHDETATGVPDTTTDIARRVLASILPAGASVRY